MTSTTASNPLYPCIAKRLLTPGVLAAVLVSAVWCATITPAAADLRICNKTTSRIGIAVGYKDNETWTTEGWWNLPASSCETLLAGTLVARYYYLYAIDYDRGGEWSGRSFMCTQEKTFTIKGIEDCLKRGFERTGFFEIDTGDQRNWTVQLTEPGRAGARHHAGDGGSRSRQQECGMDTVRLSALPWSRIVTATVGAPSAGFLCA
eukprot:gene19666-20126_t